MSVSVRLSDEAYWTLRANAMRLSLTGKREVTMSDAILKYFPKTKMAQGLDD